MGRVAVAITLLVALLLGGPSADANDAPGDSLPGTPDIVIDDHPGDPDDPDVSVDSETEITVPAPPSGQDPIEDTGGDPAPDGVTTISADVEALRDHPIAVVTPPCGAEWQTSITVYFLGSFINVPLIPPVCPEPLTCHSERIDDFYFGRISGSADPLAGNYGAYLTEFINNTADAAGPVDIDIDTTNQSILGQLGDPPDPLAMATFHFCRRDNDNTFETGAEWGPRFAWDTNVTDEYPVAETLDDLYIKVKARLDVYTPDAATAPPLETGHTFVRLPTWFWIDEALNPVSERAVADTGLIDIAVQATLVEVQFHIGDTTVTCQPDDLVAFIANESDPFEHPGDCHHTFDRVADHDLSTTMTYVIEERTRQRRHESFAWPDTAWTPHPTDPQPAIDHDHGSYDVHELLSVNVSETTETASG